MKMFLFTLALMTMTTSAFSEIIFTKSRDIDLAHTNIHISDARYLVLPSKTETRDIPGCINYGEVSRDCTEVIVLEREPVVQVTVSYTEGVWRDPDTKEGYVVMNLDPQDFSAETLETLKSNSSRVWDLSGRQFKARRNWIKQNLNLEVKVATRTIQVVDTRNSRLCPVMENGETLPNCVEVLRYKPAQTKVREVTISLK